MTSEAGGAWLIATPSFEERSIAAPEAFLRGGGEAARASLATLGGGGGSLQANLSRLEELRFTPPVLLDRLSAQSLWSWAWASVNAAGSDVIVDSTTIPRELLAMLLFALSVRRRELQRVRIWYTSPESYVTQSEDESARWLSRGIRRLRSVVGFPGSFAADRQRHVVALAGHEDARLLEIISFLEPTRLSIGSEQRSSSTVPLAQALSVQVKERLREEIGLPECGDVVFYANSIGETFASLKSMLQQTADENVAIVAMNTKLSFIGAALCALQLRHVRLVYAVPVEYNPLYSVGVRETQETDITDLILQANTIPALPDQAQSHLQDLGA